MKRIIFILFLLNTILLNAQIKPNFTDGIYLNFQQFKTNKPIKKSQIATNLDTKSYDFFETLLNKKYFEIYDNVGGRITISTKEVWGYCNNKTIFIKYNDDFNRIPVVGEISHFIAYKTFTYTNTDPFMNSRANYYPQRENTTTELRKYILDFKSGTVKDFNYKTVDSLISRDSLLHKEYSIRGYRNA